MKIRQVKEFGLDTVSALGKSQKVLGLPVHLTIEPTNVCNLKCPVCETGAGILNRPKGFMSLADFKTVIDRTSGHVNTLFFYYMGEPFLNKEAYDMIHYASQKGMYVSACTNGEFVDAVKLLDSGMGEISFQFGGMTPKTHRQYRVKGDFNLTVDNLVNLIITRNIRRRRKPRIIAGFIVMRHNEHEVDKFVEWCKKVGVDKAQIINPCVRNMEQGKEFMPEDGKYWFYDREAFEKGILRP